ncbi:hypothetical protein F4820DRAFT_439976 [Hypoxylon rubiginosum]|uniref:Uncharacterized protein n=1 Tax=Hypoxylon rubiginosum TaxID=110542 RepID=A0ACB9YJJ1_9PEZI|nr:hypothetical protein F4820DRAFT_439976 [Hypoxylon rubiginosum]
MATSSILHTKLDALYEVWSKLSLESSPAEFQAFADFFSEDCTAWLLSMRELKEPSIGREGVIAGIKEALKNTHIKERRVVDRFESAGGSKISVEMDNRLVVQGKDLERFPETATAVFNEQGLIADFKLYCCRSPVVEIIQEVTGIGPYVTTKKNDGGKGEKCH